MTTIQDVARKAGVAPMTVSRVINQSGYASADVKKRVLEAAEELGYTPNALARGLRQHRTHTLALVLTDVTNPFFTTVARGVEDAASAAGYLVIFANSDESVDKEARYLDAILPRQVDGVLLVPAGDSRDAVKRIRAKGVPLVLLDRRVPEEEVDLVHCDSRDGAYRLTRLLLDLGHRQIALINGQEGVFTADERRAGFERAMAEAGCSTTWVYSGAFTVEAGAALAREALTAHPRPTALVASNNFLAIGAMRAAQAIGLEVPDDLALVAFDDLPESLMLTPFLTAAVQPAYAMGQRAAELLISRLNNQEIAEPEEIVLPVELVLRASSGPALR